VKKGVEIIRHMLPRPRNVIDLGKVPRGGFVLDLGPSVVEVEVDAPLWGSVEYLRDQAAQFADRISEAFHTPYPEHLRRQV
jgi:hypothetical protein